MPRRERVDCGHSRNDLVLESRFGLASDLFDDAQRAVVERGIAPHEKRANLPVGELAIDHRRELLGPSLVPRGDCGLVVDWIAIT